MENRQAKNACPTYDTCHSLPGNRTLFGTSKLWRTMAQRDTRPPAGNLSGQAIINELIRNMELGQFEMAYSVLLPCVFSLYLHPDDYTRLAGVFDLIAEDAKRALCA